MEESTPARSARGGLLPALGGVGPAELEGDDVQRVTRAILLLATTAEKITFLTAQDPPPKGSAANGLYRSTESGHALEGFITMQYANMSAMDHSRAFVALIRTPTVRSTALASVARGTLESLARTWHLLQRTTGNDFIYRVISLLRSDLRYSEILGNPLQTRNGDPVDPSERRAYYAGELSRLGLPAPARPDLSKMVAEMLDAEMEKADGRSRYSLLSSIAHAHRFGINTFVTTGVNGDISGLAAPRPVVMNMVGEITAATYGTMHAFVDFYGNQNRHVELLETAMKRALETMMPVMDSIWPES